MLYDGTPGHSGNALGGSETFRMLYDDILGCFGNDLGNSETI